MGRFKSVFGLLAVFILLSLTLFGTASGAKTDRSAAAIPDPAPFIWTFVSSPEPHYVGVLEYGEATFNINGETLTTRAYRQQGGAYSIPGPTMNMAPGNKYILRFRNLLPYEAPNPVHNIFRNPNITNVHTHGLHISGDSPGDDVFRMFEGGFGGDYVWDIPADHMGGTFWYHAHHHGSTFLQVSTGGFGLIVIDDGADGLPANVAAMEERHILIGYLDPSVAGTGGDTIVGGTFQPGWTVNGMAGGDLIIPPDTWQHWRVLLADREALPKPVVFGPECEAMLLARDGVWRTLAPKALPTGTQNLTGASRADFAVRCSADSTLTVDGTQVAGILISGTADPAPHPFAPDGVSQWSAVRPTYLRDLRSVANVNRETVLLTNTGINGVPFDPDTPLFTMNADSVQAWLLQGAFNHPFHLHVYHFQAKTDCGSDFEAGEYYDVISENCEVRFDLNAATSSPFSGKTVFHCHILEHEDTGVMAWMDVIGGQGPPAFPAGLGYSAYYAFSATPTPSSTASPTGTATQTGTATLTPSPSPSPSSTNTATATSTATASASPSGTATETPLPPTATPSHTATATGTSTPTPVSPSPTGSATLPAQTATSTATFLPPTATESPSPTASTTPTTTIMPPSPTASATATSLALDQIYLPVVIHNDFTSSTSPRGGHKGMGFSGGR